MILKTQREHLLATVEQKDRQYAFQYAWWENVFLVADAVNSVHKSRPEKMLGDLSNWINVKNYTQELLRNIQFLNASNFSYTKAIFQERKTTREQSN